MSVTPAPVFYTAAAPGRNPALTLIRHGHRTHLSPRATWTPSLPPATWCHSLPDPPASAPPCPPVKGRRPITTTPFLSLSLAALSSPGEARCAPYTSPRCLLSEQVTRVSPKLPIDIIHPPPRSSCHRAAPVDLRCHLHFDENCTGALLLPDIQVDASDLSFGRMPVSPSASTMPPPLKKCRRIAPSATSSGLTLLGEPCRHPSCPATSPHRPHTHVADHAAWEPLVSLGHPRHHADSGYGDHAVRTLAWANQATAAWPWAASTGRRLASGHRASRPPRPIGFSDGPKDGLALCTIFPVFQFRLHF
jgi:hypothetical protein